MKIVDQLTIGLFIACLSACDTTTVTFSEAQPSGEPQLSQLPDSLTGTFYDHDNGTVLTVSPFYLITRDTLKDTFSYKILQPYETIRGDTLFDYRTHAQYPVKKTGDSLFTGYVLTDTIFDLKKKNVLKEYQQQYFLNRPWDDSSWAVQKLTYRNGVLNIRRISTRNEVKMMETITGTTGDTARPLRVSPDKEALGEFIKEDGFMQGKTFIRKPTLNSAK
ncbi:MAG: hypothetical protein J7599_16640 [Niabella sp.]|nr:hypothetical protein [Niabella sp.]